jgi:hypothetical protein
VSGQRVGITAMTIQFGPLNGFVIIKVGKPFSCEFPNEEGDDSNQGYTTCNRHSDNGASAKTTA